MAVPVKNKGGWLFWIDMLNAVLGFALLGTAVILRWVLPPGSGGGGFGRGGGFGGGRWGRGGESAKTLLSLTRHEWGDAHFWIALVFVVGILVHLVLHFGWLKAVIPRYIFPGSKIEYGVHPKSASNSSISQT
jgi:hypothetical protein